MKNAYMKGGGELVSSAVESLPKEGTSKDFFSS